jgi:hypothetical protein
MARHLGQHGELLATPSLLNQLRCISVSARAPGIFTQCSRFAREPERLEPGLPLVQLLACWDLLNAQASRFRSDWSPRCIRDIIVAERYRHLDRS